MSPDNTQDPNAAPDFSSVPLPEENPIRSPYAPVTGTLGDVADDLDQPTSASAAPAAAPTPSGAFTVPEDTPAAAPETPVAPASTPDTTIPTAGTLGAHEEAFIPGVSAEKVEGHIPDPNAPTKKGKGKLIGIICGAVVLVAAIVLGVIFIPKLINNNGGGGGGNGHTGPLFAANAFVVKELTTTSSSLIESGKAMLFTNDGKKIGDKYDYLGDLIDGAALAKKNGMAGIINDKGEEVVEFGKYQEIVEYGGLYGATDENGKGYLLDGTGRVVREYTNEFDNYSALEANGRAAYTLFSLGSGKYDVYSARGEKLTTIEAGESTPTISSNNFSGDNSVTAIFYDGKMILYGDSGNEITHKDNVSRERMLIKDADTKHGVYLFSTVTDTPLSYNIYVMPTDGRSHAVIIGENYSDIPSSACPLVTYERMEGGNQIGVLVCHVTNNIRKYIDNNGTATAYDISKSTLSYSGVGDYGGIKMYPAGVNRYIMQAPDNNGYSIYVDGKPVKTFIDESASGPLTGKMHKAFGPAYYNPGDMYPYYLVMSYTSTESSYGLFSDNLKYLIEASFYDAEGNKVCSLDKETAQKYDPSYFKGFDSNGLAIIGYLNDYVLINKKCEVVTERSYSGITHQGYFYSANSYGAERVHHYLNSEGKVAEGISHDSTIIRSFSEMPDVTILTSDSIMTLKGKILERAYGDNFENGDKYLAFVAKHDDKYRIVYYLRDTAEQFYETDIDANEIKKGENN